MRKPQNDDSYLARLLFLLTHPTKQMIAAGLKTIPECVEAGYVGATAPQDILASMVTVALKEADRG